MDPECFEVRLAVKQATNVLSSSGDGEQIAGALRELKRYLDGDDDPASAKAREEFANTHFSRFLDFLIRNLKADWLELLSPDEQRELWDVFFLKGPADQVFMVLLHAIISTSPSFRMTKCVALLEVFLRRGRMADLMWEACQKHARPDSALLREALLAKMVSLPDHMGNKLQQSNRDAFYPQNYFPLLGREIVRVLDTICKALKEEVLHGLVPHLTALTQSDCIWQRICWRLLEDVPDRWMEGVVSGLVQVAPGPEVLSRLLGNLILKNKKAQFVFTHKLLLLQYKYKTQVLQSLLGYLAIDNSRRHLLIQVLQSLLETWGNSSAVRHTPIEQQLYISKAILICMSLLKQPEIQDHRQELLSAVMGGMKSHLDSSLPRVRRIGMIVGECVSAKIDPAGNKLQFQYEEDEESRELLSLMKTTVFEPVSDAPQHESGKATLPEPTGPSENLEDQAPAAAPLPGSRASDSELDSDDELTPYDMSADTELKKSRAPVYINDCLEVLTTSEDPEKVEVTLMVLEGLIRKNPSATKEVSMELVKVLLHLEDRYNVEGFLHLRQGSMVAATVVDTVPVTQFLTTEFYGINYSLRQRMDILDVLAVAAQELSQPDTGIKPDRANSSSHPFIQVVSTSTSSDPGSSTAEHWRKVMDQRIESKTRRFAKGRSKPEPTGVPNRFNPLAGYFFFPLIRNYDRPQMTFDLLGDDQLVLGRLVHTLGILMYLAVNTTVVAQMGKALLDFIWAIRYHTDTYVRQGVLFSVSSVLLSVPGERLLSELTDEVLEARSWLIDAAEKDSDEDCRRLALQSLVLMEKMRKSLEPSLSK
ncbi:telomere length regulation protein TEL2 homolog isoform X2 [Latimeria chalumnae]|uniref:telomere length regulation protein TEL2 homolog isoform X2 n=1 Tax=Latimeria chalumnae TaxID=7897 RepID=UPI00313CA891